MRVSKALRVALMGCAGSAAMVIANPTLAQESADAGVKALEEIQVTARRRTESLQDVPIAVSAFSGSDLALRGAADITELAQMAPSVTLEPSRATSSTLTAFIRGVGQQDPLAGFEQGVALYLDDIYMARPQGALLDIYDVERVEILRGPQGTLYGRNAVGGAIKYVTKRLGDEPEFGLKLSYGSYNQVDAVAKAAMPISDKVRVGATVASLNRDGFGENLTTGEEHYNKQILAARASIEFLPSDDLFIRVSADYTDDDSNSVAGHRPYAGAVSGTPVTDSVYDTYAGATENGSTSGIDGNNEVTAKGIQGTIEWAASDTVTLKSITAYREDYTESVIDFDSLAVDDMDAPVIYDNEQFSQELQLLYTGNRLSGVFGFYYLDASASNDFDVVLGQLGRAFYGSELVAYTGGTVDTKAWSLFADLSYEVNDAVSLSVGGRYTNDKRSADIFRANYLGQGSPFFGFENSIFLAASSDFESERTFKDFSPRIALDYKINEDALVYASFSRGFKAGSFDPRGANLTSPEVEDGFDAETLDSYEIGLKSTWLDGRARTNLAVFYSDYKDMQIPGSLPIDTDGDGTNDGFVGTVTNAGKATIKGIEFEGTFLLSDNLTLQTSLNLLDAEIKEWLLNGVNVADQRAVQNTPEFMSYVGMTYMWPMSNGSTISFNGNWSHKGSIVQFETPVTEIDQDAYSLFNASIVWTSENGNYSLGLHGKNLGNKEYKTAGYNFPTLGLENNITTFYGPPRTITATLGLKF
ncbi:TonB-dependent receptor [Kordiimonas sp.]|uniref:TonB-dependent receptor n=1 Tax=Kordiimonas sp. TaxID=1970157 RepID=UPI003A8FC8BA